MLTQRRRIQLFTVSLISFILITIISTLTLLIKSDDQNTVEMTALSYRYQKSLSVLINDNIQSVSLFLNSLVLPETLDPKGSNRAQYSVFKKKISNNIDDLMFIWNIGSSYLYKADDNGIYRLDATLNSIADDALVDFPALVADTNMGPASIIACSDVCHQYIAVPYDFSADKRIVLIVSIRMTDIFINFTKIHEVNIAVIRLNDRTSRSLLDTVFHNPDKQLDYGEILNQTDVNYFLHNDSSYQQNDFITISNDGKRYTLFDLPIRAEGSRHLGYRYLITLDTTDRYQRALYLILISILISFSITILCSAILAYVFGVGMNRKIHDIERSLQAQMELVDKRIPLCTITQDCLVFNLTSALLKRRITPNLNILYVKDIFEYATDRTDYQNQIMEAMAQNLSWEKEVTFRDEDNNITIMIVSLSTHDHYDKKGQRSLLFTDITDKKKIQRYANEVTNNDRFRRELISHVSHDLRTPLTSVLLYIEKWKEKKDSSEFNDVDHLILTAEKNANKSRKLIDQLFELSCLERSQITLNQDVFSLSEMVHDIFMCFKDVAGNKNITLKMKPEKGNFLAYGDPDQIERVFNNLISNAIRHSYEDGEITVCLSHKEEVINIAVRDAGVGIPTDEIANIFVPYYQAKNSCKSGNVNRGLGLAITKRIIELHGQQIWVESTRESGTAFQFALKRP